MSAASFEGARRTAAAIAAALCVAGPLAACGRTGASPDEPPPPPPPAEQPLAGAPDASPGPATPTEDARETPPPAPATPPADAAPMDAPSAAPPGLVAMAPIPNPPESAPRERGAFHGSVLHRRHHHRRHPGRRPAYVEACPSRDSGRFGADDACAARTLRRERRVAAPNPPATARPARVAPAARRPHAPALRHGGRRGEAHAGPTRADAGAVERAARLQSVTTALASEIARTATLTAPRAGPGVAADVMLNVPASFAETLRTEAGRQGLADDAASAALVARLSGAGYTVLPEGEQRQMIAAGQPTVFHWTVTAQPGARGPLQASVAAQLLGGAAQDRMDLGQVAGARSDDGLGWRVAGVALLVALVGGAAALLARSRRRPSRRPDDGVIRRREPFTLRDDDRPQA